MNTTAQIRQITAQDLAALGVHHIAYVKPTTVDGQLVFVVHAADGAELAVLPSRESAIAAIRQNDMEPLSVH
ncbi:MAG: DUF1150 family protein [Kiloniellales bacterium]|nr:DUF1150 family protein [Kiloniellales bacterium]